MSLANKYEFRVEQLAESLEDVKPLLAENHAETGVYNLPFNPDYERLLFLEQHGDLKLFVIRHDTKAVGVAIFYLDQEIYQKELWSATQATNFVTKKHRGIGLAFMKFCDDILSEQGVNSIWRQSTTRLEISKIYERMGYASVEKSYLKRIF